jgi:hypothetical protein
MLGPARYRRPAAPETTRASERARVLITVDYCDGDKKRAAAMLGITIESLNRKLEPSQSEAVPQDELASTNGTRRFFDGINANWQVTNFDPIKREVCTTVNLPHGKNRFSTIVAKPF